MHSRWKKKKKSNSSHFIPIGDKSVWFSGFVNHFIFFSTEKKKKKKEKLHDIAQLSQYLVIGDMNN